MITTAAVVSGQGEGFHLTKVELDDPRVGEVLVDIVAVGMCHTDLSAASGVIPFPLPGVLGHEGAGRIRAVGPGVSRVSVGDPVLLSFTSCGRCVHCRSGHPAYCVHHLDWNLLGGRRADGSSPVSTPEGEAVNAHFFGQSSFAQQAIADERAVVKLPPDTTDAELALYAPFGCGLQTGAGAVINVLAPRPGSVIAISGAGAVGLAAVMAAAALSVQTIIVIDIVDSRLRIAEELGAHVTIDASRTDVATRLQEISPEGVDAAIETTGNVGVLETMVELLAIAGTCLVIGAPKAGSRASFNVNAHLPGRRIVGVTLGDSEPERFVSELIALHRAGRFPIERIERTYAFDQIATAAADAASGATIKPVLIMGDLR